MVKVVERSQWVKHVFICRSSGCGLTEEGCSSLTFSSDLQALPSETAVDLNFSHLGDSGLKKLSAALETLK